MVVGYNPKKGGNGGLESAKSNFDRLLLSPALKKGCQTFM